MTQNYYNNFKAKFNLTKFVDDVKLCQIILFIKSI